MIGLVRICQITFNGLQELGEYLKLLDKRRMNGWHGFKQWLDALPVQVEPVDVMKQVSESQILD